MITAGITQITLQTGFEMDMNLNVIMNGVEYEVFLKMLADDDGELGEYLQTALVAWMDKDHVSLSSGVDESTV